MTKMAVLKTTTTTTTKNPAVMFLELIFRDSIFPQYLSKILYQEHLHQLLQTIPISKMLQFPLCIDELFEHFKQSTNKSRSKMSVKKLLCTAPIHLLKRWMHCSNITEIAPNSLHETKMARHAKPQPLFLQMSLLKVDYAYAWHILSMQTAVLCYTPPLNNG